MKKVLSFLLVIGCLIALCSCNGEVQDVSAANKLVYGEKYILASDVSVREEKQRYFIFEKDHLIYHHYYNHSSITGSDQVSHHTYTCKYQIMDEDTLAYFYDSVEIHSDHNNRTTASTATHGILLFSENVITNSEGQIFVRQSYLENELPNFGKE